MARDRRLQRLRRDELLQIMLELEQENEQLTDEKLALQARLDERAVALDEAGTLAEAALQLGGVFDAAQEAADIYLRNVEELCERREAESAGIVIRTRAVCDELVVRTREACLALARETQAMCDESASPDAAGDDAPGADVAVSLVERVQALCDAAATEVATDLAEAADRSARAAATAKATERGGE